MGHDTEQWPFVQAKHFHAVPVSAPRKVRVLVLHDMEFPEKMTAAEDVAHYFATMPDGRVASAHVCVDADSVVQCVHDRDVAYAAPGCNHDGISIELAGFMAQSREEWLDAYGAALLHRAADVVAQYCIKYDMPPRKLTDTELAGGARGIVGHDQVSRVYKKSDHQDPGPHFPWDAFMQYVGERYAARIGA